MPGHPDAVPIVAVAVASGKAGAGKTTVAA